MFFGKNYLSVLTKLISSYQAKYNFVLKTSLMHGVKKSQKCWNILHRISFYIAVTDSGKVIQKVLLLSREVLLFNHPPL